MPYYETFQAAWDKKDAAAVAALFHEDCEWIWHSSGKTMNKETWLGMMDFRRRKWRPKGSTNSVAQLSLSPRITMILGLASDGAVYVSLSQTNSNGQLMDLLFHSLVRKLD